MLVYNIVYDEDDDKEGEEDEESHAAAAFGQWAVLAEEEAVEVKVVLGHYFLRFLRMARTTRMITAAAKRTTMMTESSLLYFSMTVGSAAW